MNEIPTKYDWTAARGDKWRAHLFAMEAMLEPVEEPLIHALRLDAPYRVADIGCGGGGTALEIRRRSPVGSVIHGFDICETLIDAARGRARDDGLAFEVADAATASPPELPYDRLVSRFGVMFFDDPDAAFRNLLGWLAPRGRFAFAVWGQPADNPWVMTVREVVAEVIELPPSDPAAPGPFRYAEAETLRALIDQVGFAELEIHDWRGSLPIGGGLSAEAAARFALASFSFFGEALAKAGEAALDEARRSLTKRFLRHQHGGVVRMDACVHIFTGTRAR